MNNVNTNEYSYKEVNFVGNWEYNYERWYSEAREEFENGEFYEDSFEADFEVMDDGSVVIQGNMFHVINHAVTSWYDSKYFTELDF